MNYESFLDRVRRMLQERKGEWRQIASASGVPYSTVCKVAEGWHENPNVHTVQKLHDTVLAMERAE